MAAARKMESTALKARGQIPPEYSLSMEECQRLNKMCVKDSDSRLDAIAMAFRYGFVLGTRAHDKQRVKTL